MTLAHFLHSTAAVVLTFGLVIFLHESGHFFLCRILGVRVEKFAFGFGPELFGISSKGTRFSICAFPLGGFVKPAGEELESCTGKPDEYFAQNWKRRLLIVAAGPAMNYILAFSLFTGVLYLKGMPQPSNLPKIGNMMIGYPADAAGLRIGDVIKDVAGERVRSWKDLADAIHQKAGRTISLIYDRNGVENQISLVPKKDDDTGLGVIGILPDSDYQAIGFLSAAKQGALECWAISKMTVTTIADKIWKRKRPDLAGPIGIVQMVSKAADSGWEDLVSLIAMISVAIGFFNILPVPLLDGGHAAAYVWEGVSGRKPTKGMAAAANGVGFALLISLLLFATYNDILRLKKTTSPAKAFTASAAAR
ncbi:MAG: M50 family metallopeptidase [Elusimicrobiota bacterium]